MNYPQEHIKPYGTEGKKSEQVEQMFDNIAPAYDMLNHTLSLGIDKSWRRKAIKWLRPFQPQRVMDVATGTGDFAILAYDMLRPERLIGTDISEGMMNVGREKVKRVGLSDKITFVREDCTSLSFADNSFDAVTVAFGIRNFGINHTRPFPDKTVVCPLFQNRHSRFRQAIFKRQQCLPLSAANNQSLPAGRGHGEKYCASRIQPGRVPPADVWHLYTLYGYEIMNNAPIC